VPETPACGRQRQKDCDFKTSEGYKTNPGNKAKLLSQKNKIHKQIKQLLEYIVTLKKQVSVEFCKYVKALYTTDLPLTGRLQRHFSSEYPKLALISKPRPSLQVFLT
jgi:hypothetical protein